MILLVQKKCIYTEDDVIYIHDQFVVEWYARGPICKIVKHSSLLLGLGPWLSSTWLGGVVGLLCHADRCELEGTRQFPLIGSGKGRYISVCVGGS